MLQAVFLRPGLLLVAVRIEQIAFATVLGTSLAAKCLVLEPSGTPSGTNICGDGYTWIESPMISMLLKLGSMPLANARECGLESVVGPLGAWATAEQSSNQVTSP